MPVLPKGAKVWCGCLHPWDFCNRNVDITAEEYNEIMRQRPDVMIRHPLCDYVPDPNNPEVAEVEVLRTDKYKLVRFKTEED